MVGIYEVSSQDTNIFSNNKFWGAAAVGNRVVFAPFDALVVDVYDMSIDTFTTASAASTLNLFCGAAAV
eukprot:3702850-Prymnesium_polylepis.1